MGIIDTPLFKIVLGLVVFYIGLKMFAGGMKSLGHVKQLEPFVTNPYWMFLGGILCTLAWQSSSLSTTVLGANIGTTGTIWLASFFVSDGFPIGPTRQIALMHTGANLLMGVCLLPWVHHIARFIQRF